MGNFVTFRINTGKKEGTVSFKGGIAKDKDGVEKFINYWPGGNGIFDENNKNNAVKAKSVVFKYNDILSDPAVEIVVRKSDKQLLDYLMAHPAYGKKYRIHDEDELAKDKAKSYDSIAKAMDYVRKSDDIEIQGMAVCVLGAEYHGKSPNICKAALNEKAINDPAKVIEVVEDKNFTSRYLASKALITGKIKTNDSHTAVVWGDTNGVIINIAKGENGLDKLTELLGDPKEGKTLLQELGNRLEGNSVSAAKDDKDKEIARLKRELEKANSSKKEIKKAPSEYDELTIDELLLAYLEKFEKNVPFKYKNNSDWIIGKLTE